MDFEGLQEYVRRLVADSTGDRFTSEDIQGWLNEAYLDVHRDIKPQSSYVSDTIPALSSTIVLPSDFQLVAKGGITIKDLTQDDSPRELTRREISDLNRLHPGWQSGDLDPGLPTDYLLRDDASVGYIIVLVPAPENASTFWLEYVPRPVLMSADTDEPWGGRWPEHHKAIAHQAEVYARMQEGDFEAQQKAEQRAVYEKARFRASVETIDTASEPVLKGSIYDDYRTYRRR
jgi:hypothetical protein